MIWAGKTYNVRCPGNSLPEYGREFLYIFVLLRKDCINMEYEEIKDGEEIETESRFGRGVVTGILGTVLVAAAFIAITTAVFGRCIVIGPNSSAENNQTTVLSSDVMHKVNELIGYINLYFYDDVEDEKLADGIYAGLLEGLEDEYSEYYTPQEYENLQISATQNYYGIGAGLLQDKDSMQVTITHIYEGSPAEAAGLKENDIVVMVGDIEASSMELSDLVTHIRGEEGTTVHLQIYREGEADYLEFDVERANIDLPTVEHRMLDDNIGYIQILEFGAPTIKQFEAAVSDLAGQGMKGMIIDVRDNPGGMITSVTGILDDILPEGTVVYTQDKYGKRQDYTSDGSTKMEYPIAVLINGNSASASEILAGAIRDFEYGTLIGTKTFGKGIVQTIFSLSEGDAIKLTTAKYFTPKGENIHGTGIEPDIELKFEYQGDLSKSYDELKDNQVLKAVEVLNEEISVK